MDLLESQGQLVMQLKICKDEGIKHRQQGAFEFRVVT